MGGGGGYHNDYYYIELIEADGGGLPAEENAHRPSRHENAGRRRLPPAYIQHVDAAADVEH